MKFRLGFVSNSSSSSFTCDICHCSEVYGNDADMDYAEDGFVRCINGHEFCEKHMSNNIFEEINNASSPEEMLKFFNKIYTEVYNEEFSYNERDLHDNFINNDQADNIIYDMRYNCPPQYCPICSFGDFKDRDFVEIYLQDNKCSRADIAKVLKNRFGDYKTLRKKIDK